MIRPVTSFADMQSTIRGSLAPINQAISDDSPVGVSVRLSQAALSDDALTAEIEELIAKRTEARAAKDWATADAIRDRLNAMNVVVVDTKDGISWHFA